LSTPPHTLLYAHGFRSSSRSAKASLLRAALAGRADAQLVTPDLSPRPAQAISQLQWHALGIAPQRLTLVGSSLGGFYATVLAEKLGCRAVLLNPSIRPYETLAAHVGRQTNLHTGEVFDFTREHLAELAALAVPRITRPRRYLLIVEMGDELLDHHATCAFFEGAQVIAEAGGNHDLISFPHHLGALLAFAMGRAEA
jgi:hypothetical protein